jgi:VanZ family protein
MPADQLPRTGIRIPHLDKFVHFFLYGVMAGLLWRSFVPWDSSRAPALPCPALVLFAFPLLVGAFDEWHQIGIRGRSPDVLDWLCDSLGALTVIGTGLILRARSSSRSREQTMSSAMIPLILPAHEVQSRSRPTQGNSQ